MRIALLGGSFNPVHLGHVALGKAAVELAGYDKVVFVPAYQSPFKQRQENAGPACPSPTDEDRITMLKLAVSQYPWAEIELCEIMRGGVSYSIDTIRQLTGKYRTDGLLCRNGERCFLEGRLGMIIGSDLVAGFSGWKEADALAEEADIILAKRPGQGFSSTFPYRHMTILNDLCDISSTEVRRRTQNGEPVSDLVSPEIYGYITERGIYGS